MTNEMVSTPSSPARLDPPDEIVDGPAAVTPKRVEISFIQLLRGIAPLLVIWAHLSGFWLFAHGRSWVVQDFWQKYFVVPFHLYQNAGHLGVVLFFLISGYIITHTSLRESARDFALKRALRILPMLFVAVGLTHLVLRVVDDFHLDALPGIRSGSLLDLVMAATLLDQFAGTGFILGQTWTLAIEIAFYLIVFGLIGVSRRNPLRATWIMLGIYAVAASAAIAVPDLVYLRTTFVYLAFLIVGRTLYLFHERRAPLGQLGALLAATTVLFLVLYTAAFPGELFLAQVQPAVSYAIAVIAFIALMQARITRVVRPLAFMADISYSVYLLHLPVGMLVITAADAAGLPFTVGFVAGVLASIAASAVTYRWVEKPSQRLARTLTARRSTTETRRH